MGEGLATELKELAGDQLDTVLDLLGLDPADLTAAETGSPARVAAALDRARADGHPLDPRVLAHLEAIRRAAGRGNRSLAASLGLRAPDGDAG